MPFLFKTIAFLLIILLFLCCERIGVMVLPISPLSHTVFMSSLCWFLFTAGRCFPLPSSKSNMKCTWMSSKLVGHSCLLKWQYSGQLLSCWDFQKLWAVADAIDLFLFFFSQQTWAFCIASVIFQMGTEHVLFIHKG